MRGNNSVVVRLFSGHGTYDTGSTISEFSPLLCVCGVCAYLLRSSTAGKEVSIVVAMEGDVEDVGVAVEGLLGAVAMVNVLQ